MLKNFFYKYEWAFLLLGLALLATFVPILISADSWLGFTCGLAYVIAYVVWAISYICKIGGPCSN